MGKSLRAAILTELARFIADYAHELWSYTVLHGPAPLASKRPTGSCPIGSIRMSEPTQEHIERRVYELWQQAGFPQGRDEEFRHQAERELRNRESLMERQP